MNKNLLRKAVALLYVLSLVVGYNNNEKPNIYALLLNTSKFWFNYRQSTNTLLFYKFLKEHGVPDENILLFMPDNVACNPRNNIPGTITCEDMKREPNLYTDLEVDFKYREVSSENWLNTIRKRYQPDLPFRKRLRSNDKSILFIYMSGHGGDNYHKIQDTDILMDNDFAFALRETLGKKAYEDMLIFSDSCAAFTIFDEVKNGTNPNIVMIGSSSKGEKSYSFGKCHLLEASKTDQFTKESIEYLNARHDVDFETFMKIFDPVALRGHPAITHTYPTPLREHSIRKYIATEFKPDFSGLNFESDNSQELKSLAELAAILSK